MNKTLFTSSLLAAGSLPAVGSIITVDFGPAGLADGLVLTSGTPYVYTDLDTGVVSLSNQNFTPLVPQLRTSFQPGFEDYHAKALFTGSQQDSSGVRILSGGGNGVVADRLAYGTAVATDVATRDSAVSEDSFGNGDWGGTTGVAFIGFKRGSNTGWMAIDYQAGAPGGSIELLELRYGNAGETMTTSTAGAYTAIPEPSTAAALLAGSAALFAARRRKRA